MTKPREKTREELQAEIEDGKKKIRQYENREKMLRQKLSQEERRTRSHRLIVRGAVFESVVPEAKNMTDEEATALLRLALTSEPAREYLKNEPRERQAENPFGTKGALIHPCGRVRSAEGLSPHRELSRAPIWRLLPQQGAALLRRFAAIPAHPQKQYTRRWRLYHFCGFYYPIREVIPIAIYHWNIGIVSRGKGKSAVAAAAYRSGEKLTNEWDGMTHDYTRKGGVAHTEIMLPPHAPPSFSDRSTFVEQRGTLRESRERPACA